MFRRISLRVLAMIGTSVFAQQPVLHWIETADLDRSVQPCDDFYDFSNGAWRAETRMDTDENLSYAFTKAGTYPYYCSVRPRMTGQILVK